MPRCWQVRRGGFASGDHRPSAAAARRSAHASVIAGSGLNAFSYWLFVFGGMIAIAGFITPGGAAEFGWTGYTPLSDGLGTILGGVNTFPKSAVEQQLSRPAQPGGIVTPWIRPCYILTAPTAADMTGSDHLAGMVWRCQLH